MKNILIGVLVIGILILGYLFIKQKDKPADPSISFDFSEQTNSSPTSTNQNPPTVPIGNSPATSNPQTPPPTNPNWQSVTSSSAYTLATNAEIYLSSGSAVQLSQSVDLTGDGIDEGVFTGDGGNSGMTFILMKDVNGQNVLAKQKNKDGTISVIQLLGVGRVRVSESFKFVPEERGYYTISKSNDGESDFVCNPDGVNAYSWNTSTKLFEWNQSMTTKYTAEVCGSPVASLGPSQSQIENFVYQNSSDCSSGDCSGVSVTFDQDVGNLYLITAIFTELDDSVSATKRQWLVLFNNNSLSLANNQPNPNTWRTCHPNRGQQTFETTPCN